METTGAGVEMVDSTLSGAPMIAMEAVNKHFGSLHVLKDINLQVDRGQVIVVLGPSGSGKSTLCRTINRLETIDSGTIAIDGEVLPAEGRKLAQLRSDVGMVFQSFNLFAHKTILQNPQGQGPREGHGATRTRWHRQSSRQVSGAALRRTAATRGDRAFASDEP